MNPIEIDPLLVPYCQAKDEEVAQHIAAQLVCEQMEPVINSIVARKLGAGLSLRRDEAADVRSDILLQLLQRLQQLRQGSNETPVKNLRAYVAVTSYRGCAAYLRQQYPQRRRLQNRVRYLLLSQPQFVLRQDEEEEWSGGLAAWETSLSRSQLLSQERVALLLHGPLPFPLVNIPDPSFTRVCPAEQMQALLQWARCFVALDDLVAILAHWWGLKDQASVSLIERVATRADVEQQVGQRLYLQKLWREIVTLPVRQRQVLLLNLRDMRNPDNIIALWPALQIASLRDIALVLELSAEEFAALWPRMPLDDAEIAERLQLTRRQVVNLRGSARERLIRRTKGW